MPRRGLFGKMPSMGDFVSRGFSAGLCDALDRLLQSAIAAAGADLGEPRQVLEQSRPLMISVRPGALCDSGFDGLWFPSRDRVGRLFPLAIGQETESERATMPLPWPSPALTSRLGAALVQAIQQGAAPDELCSALPEAEEWHVLATRGMPFSNVADETVPDVSFRSSMFALRGPEEAMSTPSRALCSRLPWVAQVLGTVLGPEAQPQWYFASRSMLAWTHFAALFDGRWEHWEWTVTEPAALDETLPRGLPRPPMAQEPGPAPPNG